MFVLILALTVNACTIMSHIETPGWPQLRVTEHYVSTAAMRDVCVKYSGFGSSPYGCAEINLTMGTCDIWLSQEYFAQWQLDHERLHCEGKDHLGGTFMRDLMRAWRAQWKTI